MSRCSLVTNGCSGKCCEAVFFPYTIEELKRIKAARESQTPWIDEQGIEHTGYPTDKLVSHDYLIDMLIPLGWQTIDPETGKTYRERLVERGWKEEDLTAENLESGLRLNADGAIEGYIVTCKHFDTEKRICKDYENRPGLCRNYGAACKYSGCCYSQNQTNEL